MGTKPPTACELLLGASRRAAAAHAPFTALHQAASQQVKLAVASDTRAGGVEQLRRGRLRACSAAGPAVQPPRQRVAAGSSRLVPRPNATGLRHCATARSPPNPCKPTLSLNKQDARRRSLCRHQGGSLLCSWRPCLVRSLAAVRTTGAATADTRQLRDVARHACTDPAVLIRDAFCLQQQRGHAHRGHCCGAFGFVGCRRLVEGQHGCCRNSGRWPHHGALCSQ